MSAGDRPSLMEQNWTACPAYHFEHRVQCHKFEGHEGPHVHQAVGASTGQVTSIQWEDSE